MQGRAVGWRENQSADLPTRDGRAADVARVVGEERAGACVPPVERGDVRGYHHTGWSNMHAGSGCGGASPLGNASARASSHGGGPRPVRLAVARRARRSGQELGARVPRNDQDGADTSAFGRIAIAIRQGLAAVLGRPHPVTGTAY